LLAKLVDKGIMSPADALDVIDDVLLQFEEWQSLFPEQGPYSESARKFLEESITGYQAMLKSSPINFLGVRHVRGSPFRLGRAYRSESIRVLRLIPAIPAIHPLHSG
jgi:hypothetical protein